ncbi:MAG: hypothetical protein WCJ30_04870 [Deltaproteobacteria bacterium]
MSTLISSSDAPGQVGDLAEQCVRYVEKSTGVLLDYTPDTLPLLDHYLRQVPREGDEVQVLVAASAGAYFGEVVRRVFPCRWHAPTDDYGAWRIEFEHVFLHFNPVAFAHEATTASEVVKGGAGFGVLDQDLEVVRGGLEALGTIGEDDYFRLATRYEVLNTVVDRLTGQSMNAEDGVSIHYDHHAYKLALGEVDERPS